MVSCSVLLLAALLGPAAAQVSLRVPCHDKSNKTVYDFEEYDILETEKISLDRYRGKTMMIYNVASY